MVKPTYIIKENSQKVKNHFRKVLTRDILKDICFRITDETGINDNIKIYGG